LFDPAKFWTEYAYFVLLLLGSELRRFFKATKMTKKGKNNSLDANIFITN
jgi:hypothetical protein